MKKTADNSKKKIVLLFALTLLMSFMFAQSVLGQVSAADTNTRELKLFLNDMEIVFTDAKPFVDKNNRALIPLRAVSESIGCDVTWIPSTKQAEIDSGNKKLLFTIDTPSFYSYDENIFLAKKQIEIDTSPVIINNRTYLPVRFLIEALGGSVFYDTKTGYVYITIEDSVVSYEKIAKNRIMKAIAAKSTQKIEMPKQLDNAALEKVYNEVMSNPYVDSVLLDYSYGSSFQVNKYENDVEKINADVHKTSMLYAMIEYYLSLVTDDMSDFEKALILHDEITERVKYGYGEDGGTDEWGIGSYAPYSADNALVDNLAVCHGYSRAYSLLLAQFDIETQISTNSNHAWNMLKIDDKWYFADATWDAGGYHHYFLKSGNVLSQSRTVESSAKDSANSTKYDDLWLKDINSQCYCYNNYIYYFDYHTGKLMKCSLDGKNKTALLSFDKTVNNSRSTFFRNVAFYIQDNTVYGYSLDSGKTNTYGKLTGISDINNCSIYIDPINSVLECSENEGKQLISSQSFTLELGDIVVTSSGTTGGKVYPEEIKVKNGQPVVIAIIPDPGYYVADILVNNKSIDTNSIGNKAVYRFNATENANVSVKFVSLIELYRCGTNIKAEGGEITFEPSSGSITGFIGSPTEVIIPEAIDGTTVVAINAHAFENCKSLKSVSIPKTVTSIGSDAFYECIALQEINVANDNTQYFSVDGVLYARSSICYESSAKSNSASAFETLYKETLVRFPPAKKGNFTVPATVERVEDQAFSNSNLSELVIPKTVISIGDYVMSRSRIKKASIYSDLKYGLRGTVSSCPYLEELYFYGKVPRVLGIFYYNTNLKIFYTAHDMVLSDSFAGDIFYLSKHSPNVTIYGPNNSTLMNTALKNGLSFKPIS